MRRSSGNGNCQKINAMMMRKLIISLLAYLTSLTLYMLIMYQTLNFNVLRIRDFVDVGIFCIVSFLVLKYLVIKRLARKPERGPANGE